MQNKICTNSKVAQAPSVAACAAPPPSRREARVRANNASTRDARASLPPLMGEVAAQADGEGFMLITPSHPLSRELSLGESLLKSPAPRNSFIHVRDSLVGDAGPYKENANNSIVGRGLAPAA